jgi:hypothetical protein
MKKTMCGAVAVAALSAVLGLGSAEPASASPLLTGAANVNAGTVTAFTEVRSRGARRGGWARGAGVGIAAGAVIGGALAAPYAYDYGPGPAYGYGGGNYGYLSSNGRVYSSCVFDEGYGRVLPCDSGNH